MHQRRSETGVQGRIQQLLPVLLNEHFVGLPAHLGPMPLHTYVHHRKPIGDEAWGRQPASLLLTEFPDRINNELHAGLTQLAECQLPKLGVAGSSPVSRSKEPLETGALFLSE